MIPRRIEQWFKALLAAIIGGAAQSGLAALGITGAQAAGVAIQQLSLKQLGAVCVSGAVIGAMLYLKQSPVPPDSTGDTAPPFPPPKP
jgi:hypothetical protein